MKLRTLFPHQHDALAWALKRNRIALFMEMRLGKTLTVIRWTQLHPGAKILVVAPLSVLPTWKEELQKEGIFNIHLLTGKKEHRRLESLSNSGFFLINYEGLRVTPSLCSRRWKYVILDESTRIRNPKALITKLLTLQFSHVPYKAILSGLPAPEGPENYFEQFNFLHGDFMRCSNFWQFRKKYFLQDRYDWILKRTSVTPLKEAIRKNAFVLSRKKAGMGKKKVYEKRYVEFTPGQLKAYKQVRKDFEYISENQTLKLITKWATTRFLWMSRLAGGFDPKGEENLSSKKAEEIIELLMGELKNEKIIVWFRFNKELEYIHNCLSCHGIMSFRITGDTKLLHRKNLIKSFKDGICNVLLMQLKVGKFGLDLSNASTAIYYSNSYDMEDRIQSEDRIISPSKNEPLLYIDLITKNSIDENVVKILRMKNIDSKFFMTALLTEFIKDRKE